jgi:rapamycin-insensitive companion of mTOR
MHVPADRQEKNLLYVIEVEIWVSQTLRPFTSDTVQDYWYVDLIPSTRHCVDKIRSYDGTAPSHFFGEMTKTPEGCRYIRKQGVVAPLAEIVRLHGLEPRDESILTDLKCAMWALVGLDIRV